MKTIEPVSLYKVEIQINGLFYFTKYIRDEK